MQGAPGDSVAATENSNRDRALKKWSEAHFLVFGNWQPILRMARRFRQNGIVIIRRSATRFAFPHFLA